MEREGEFPKIVLFPRIERVGRFVHRLVSFCPLNAPDYMSDHYEHPLDTPVELVTDFPGQLELDYGTTEDSSRSS